MSDAASKFALLAAQMADHETNWSLGTFGAIAEFMRDADEPVTLSRDDACVAAAVTARGGIRIEPRADVRLFASKSTTRESWSHRVSLCLPQAECAMNGRTVLTALGPDEQALREQDRRATLFDLGLGALQVDVCIRAADPDVTAQLLPHTGRPLFEPGNPAMGVIVASSPHRVFASRVGRIEVFNRSRLPTAGAPKGPTPTCCRSCCSIAALIRRPSPFPTAGSLARISIPPIPRRTGMGTPRHLTPCGTRRSRTCCAGLEIPIRLCSSSG